MNGLLIPALLLSPAVLSAQSPWQRVVDLDGYGVLAPVGIQVTGSAGWRRILGGPSADPTAYFSGGAIGSITPGYGNAGVFIEALPAPFLLLRGEQVVQRFFGRWGSLVSFGSSEEPFGDGVLHERQNRGEVANGQRSSLQATPQVRVGPVILRHQATFGWWHFGGQGPWFYECENDTLLARNDRTQDHQTSLLWEVSGDRFTRFVGVQGQLTRAEASQLERRRLAFVLASERRAPHPRWGRLRGGIVVGRNLVDRNRQGSWFFLTNFGTTFSLP